MLVIKEFSEKKVILTDGKKDYELLCKNEKESFDLATLEEILRYQPHTKNDEVNNE